MHVWIAEKPASGKFKAGDIPDFQLRVYQVPTARLQLKRVLRWPVDDIEEGRQRRCLVFTEIRHVRIG